MVKVLPYPVNICICTADCTVNILFETHYCCKELFPLAQEMDYPNPLGQFFPYS